MKNLFQLVAVLIFATGFTACNNKSSHPNDHTGHDHSSVTAPKTHEDSLYKQIDKAHIAGMKKMEQLTGYISRVKSALDSVKKLPAAAVSKAASYKNSLDSLLEDLEYANMSMDTWMNEFKADSAENNTELRRQYFESELKKVTKMKDNVLGGIDKAKSFFKE